MEIRQGRSCFYIGNDADAPLAVMTYVDSGEHLVIIDHTEVSAELKGQGAGRKLLKELVEWARAADKKIMPLCPYAKAQMEKTDEYRDMIY